ncbi:ABC transporter [Arthrobacter sp. Leaf141]|uniref:ATP-binding cassette domain-containing protein n=1 Tax=Arthrobacter sp. Leaf141 TaxID=1736273 RepID=UPI0006F708FE|nr:ATP-binding cassette domain-containing protein [Arthrobacter sp. Leaf141]KQR01156.1 ABC transporter [Arthrobacter sp. Leaf141]
MSFRPAPLRAAAVLAAVFIAARVIYRVLFNGAGLGEPLLFDLPAVRLPAPFAHVAVFGPVSGPGLWAAAVSAFPIAAAILGFGVLNSLVDISLGFVRLARRGPLQGVARTLVVAWAALPALADAVSSARLAFRLRGERFGPRALVPILERTLEHAGRVAAALELRGFGATRRHTPDGGPRPGAPLTIRDAHFSIGDTRIEVTEFVPRPGVTVVTGATGAGKSTVLRGIAGLLSHVDGGSISGTVRVGWADRAAVPPRETARQVGVVLQNPRAAFATSRVRDEIGLALELRGLAPAAAKDQVREAAELVGVTALLDRNLSTLSAGEATLVAIAAAVVDGPALLLVDEPLADLDADARDRVIAVLASLARDAGICVIVAEHRAAALAVVADAWWTVADGALLPGTPPPAAAAEAVAAEQTATTAHPSKAPAHFAGEPVLEASGLAVHRKGATLVRDANLALHRGTITALVGPNGAGKSSLLVALALGEGTDRSTAKPPVQGAASGGRTRDVRVALVPDASDDLFTRDTVAGELRAAERRISKARRTDAPLAPGTAAAHLSRLRGGAPMPDGNEHPRDLSAGERRILAIALQTLDRPEVLLIDEPTRGLDPAARAAVAAALLAAAEQGAAVLIATHDLPFAHSLAARILPMRDGVAPAPALAPAVAPDPTPADAPAPVAASARPRRTAQEVPAAASPAAVSPAAQVSAAAAAPRRRRVRLPRAGELLVLAAANLLALAAFCWPLLGTALPKDAAAALPFAALAIAPVAAVAVVLALDGSVRSAHTVALLGVLAAVGTAVRVASTGVGGVEAVFILLILAGRAFGARFGLLLGAATIAVSSVVTGSLGPWTPFQVFACAWVGAGAGLLPKGVRGKAELWMLAVYGVVASYLFGLLTNLWFWPFAVGYGTGISYQPGAPLGTNLSSFLLYSLLTSTAGWDTLRAVTTIMGIVVVGRAVLAAFRRVKPVSSMGGNGAVTRSTPARDRLQLTP